MYYLLLSVAAVASIVVAFKVFLPDCNQLESSTLQQLDSNCSELEQSILPRLDVGEPFLAKAASTCFNWLSDLSERTLECLSAETIERLYFNRGLSLTIKGQWEGAKSAFSEALALNTNSARAINGLGILAFYEGDFSATLSYFERATQLEKETSGYWLNLGIFYLYMGQNENAERALQEAYSLDPHSPYPSLYQAKLLWINGDVVSAENFYRRSYEADPGREDVVEELCRFYLMEQPSTTAITWINSQSVIENSQSASCLRLKKMIGVSLQQGTSVGHTGNSEETS